MWTLSEGTAKQYNQFISSILISRATKLYAFLQNRKIIAIELKNIFIEQKSWAVLLKTELQLTFRLCFCSNKKTF